MPGLVWLRVAASRLLPPPGEGLKDRADALGVLIRAGVKPGSAAVLAGLAGVEFTGATPVSLRPKGEDGPV